MVENTAEKYGRRPRCFRFFSLLIAVLMLFTGCSTEKGGEIRIVTPLSDTELFKIDDEVCSVSEAMILMTAQKKVVEDVYGSEIWAVEFDGSSFEENIKNSLKDFLARMTCMKLMASANHITPTSEEKKQIQTCVDAYFSELKQEEIKEMNITKADAEAVFTSYFYYNKLMEVLTSDMDTEISDNDARIMQAECIYVKKTEKDQTKRLKSILEKAKAADDFAEVAQTYNEGKSVSRSISRNMLPKEVEEVVFAMTDGQISDLLETEDGYYIIHCVEDYDRKATAEHKAELIAELNEQHFIEKYDSFVENLSAQFNDKAWEKISLANMVTLSKADFFGIYKEYVK